MGAALPVIKIIATIAPVVSQIAKQINEAMKSLKEGKLGEAKATIERAVETLNLRKEQKDALKK